MQVQYEYSLHDWTVIQTHRYKKWLFGLEPLKDSDYVTCWVILIFAVLAELGLVAFLGIAVWFSLAWYYIVGDVVLIVMFAGAIMEVIRPHRPVRGLFLECIFRMHRRDELIERQKKRIDEQLRRQYARGEIGLGERYTLDIDVAGYTLATDYSACGTPTSRQEGRADWRAVTAIEIDDRMMSWTLTQDGSLYVPRAAFADDETYHRFAQAAQEYRAGYGLAGLTTACAAIQPLTHVAAS